MEVLGHRYYRSPGTLCRNRRVRGIDGLIGWAMLPGPLALSHVIYFCSQQQEQIATSPRHYNQSEQSVQTSQYDYLLICSRPQEDRIQIRYIINCVIGVNGSVITSSCTYSQKMAKMSSDSSRDVRASHQWERDCLFPAVSVHVVDRFVKVSCGLHTPLEVHNQKSVQLHPIGLLDNQILYHTISSSRWTLMRKTTHNLIITNYHIQQSPKFITH